MAANHFPEVMVVSIDDAEAIPTHAGPLRVVLVQAPSLSDARHILAVLRAKGVLLHPHGAAEGFDDFGAALEQQAAGSGSDDSQGGDLGEGLQEQDQEHLLALSDADADHLLVLSDADADADADHGHHHQAMHANDDQAAQGWDVVNLDGFRSAVDLGLLLEELVSDVTPRLVADPADLAAFHLLRAHGRTIRRIGKQFPALMGQAPVTLGNYIKNTTVAGKGGDWIASRCAEVLNRAVNLYDKTEVFFQQPGN